MTRSSFSDFDRSFGPDVVGAMANAYGAAIAASLNQNAMGFLDRETRLHIISTIVAEARKGRSDPDHLRTIALSAVGHIEQSASRG